MSRRHTIIESSEPLPPFSENLVFWAPLTEGDLTDHISGVELSHNTSEYVRWDNEMDAYQFFKQDKSHENGWNTSVIYDAINFPKGLKRESGQGYTITALCKRSNPNQSYNYPPYVVLGSYSQNADWRPSIAFSGDEPTNIRETWARRTITVIPNSNGTVKRYVNSTFNNQDSGGNGDASRWKNTLADIGTFIGVNLTRVNGYDPTQNPWIKDIRIYNRALTDEEISQL